MMRPLATMTFFVLAMTAAAFNACAVQATNSADDDDNKGSTSASSSSSGGVGGTGGTGGAGGQPPTVCDLLQMPSQAFDAQATGTAYGQTAGDFALETLSGPWRLSENFSGCDNYVFVNYFESNTGNQLWGSNPADLFATTAPNVHYFFGTYGEAAARTSKAQEMKAKFDGYLATLAEPDRAWWEKRLHYVTSELTAIEGSVGAYYQSLYPGVVFAFGIDRHQRIDPAGSLSRYSGGGFVSDLRMAGYLPHYYNFVFNRDAQAAEQQVEDVVVIDNEVVEKNNQLFDVTFPDEATMAGFDEMTLDIQASCGPGPLDCGEWDYEAYLELCENEDCSERNQIGLWITPYSRPGVRRWLVDATPFLAMVKTGGPRKIRFGMLWNMNKNTMRVSFRLGKTNAGMRPVSILPLYKGGNFNADYNDKYSPTEFSPPSSTKKVELVALISGHGQNSGNNCAEWCNHVHTFSVNGKEHVKDYPGQAGFAYGCADRVDEGVVPGQYGNWAPSRAAWCPGLEVKPWRVDVTSDVKLGETNSLEYAGSYNGGPPSGGRIRMSSFLVYYE